MRGITGECECGLMNDVLYTLGSVAAYVCSFALRLMKKKKKNIKNEQ